ncbi:receptor-like protein 12 [Arachis ipaensis]|uniref:receptor-like protein 12 n=1 Tax=Arachis ipaensis TaxID=130454 RepID=UPI000A2AF7CB|nr:receptor-like protein 12 [Arachis ipaensis]
MGYLWSLVFPTLFLFLFSLLFSSSTIVKAHQCHGTESNALLQFKESFVISKFASYNHFSYPKTVSWMPSIDCCSWDGIECDEVTGHVIGIDLSSSQLYGSIDANSSLFSLVHLQSLDLSDNDFNHSQIPTMIGNFSQLRYLNASKSGFSSSVPDVLTNLTYLQSLDLSHCDLYGEFPVGIFHLPNLTTLVLAENRNLNGVIPDFQSRALVNKLIIPATNFGGRIPTSIGNLTSLKWLSIAECNFQGSIPSSFGNLNQLVHLDLFSSGLTTGNFPLFFVNFTQLSFLDLERCNLTGEIPSWIMNLTSLNHLRLHRNMFHGEIPYSLFRMDNLEYLSLGFNMLQGELELGLFLKMRRLSIIDLSYNKLSLLNEKGSFNATLPPLEVLFLDQCNLTGRIPTWIMNLTGLQWLGLQENYLQGEIPHLLFSLENLETLSLSYNSFEGELESDMFLKLKKLIYLSLSDNKLTLLPGKSSSNGTLPPLEVAGLDSCNLVEFPSFLQDLDQLVSLRLSNNDFKSVVPNWIWEKKSIESLSIFNSSLTGEISPLICNIKSLVLLDLANNNLSGTIPSCLGSSSQSLQIMMLPGNKLFGHLPQTYVMGSALKMIDVADNDLQGQLPRELVNCRMLEFLDVSYNKINDSFPYWLGSLPELKVIALRFNEFHGTINCPSICTFPKLHILDLSHNKFSGNLTPKMIKNWKSMTTSNISQLQYEDSAIHIPGKFWFAYIFYSFTMSNKGVVTDYEHIQKTFYCMVAIDISSNRISGEIPSVLGDLKSLVLLNMSNNLFIGDIPSSFRKLSNLEALDLSLNSLSGKIPQELAELTFLEFFNVSFNKLSGPIPENKQFSTFEGNCFAGNQGLCGIQLKKKCEDGSWSSPTGLDSDHDSGSIVEFDWKIILIGYGGGVVAGLALGNAFGSDILIWLKGKKLLC